MAVLLRVGGRLTGHVRLPGVHETFRRFHSGEPDISSEVTLAALEPRNRNAEQVLLSRRFTVLRPMLRHIEFHFQCQG